jgi:hypothetical protein
MTVSFFNPRFEKPRHREINIRHESNQHKIIAASPERLWSPKRNPILLNNEEAVHEFKPSIRCVTTSRNDATRTDEYAFISKARGEYNHIHNPVNPDPKPQGKKTNISQREECSQEQPRRVRKGVMNASMKFLNPITHGDPDSVTLCKKRSPPEISEATKRLNERKIGITFQQATSPRGRVCWDTNISLAMDSATDRSLNKSLTQRLEPASKRHRRTDSMKEVIQYSDSLPYRDQVVSGKCTNIPFSEITRTAEY